MFGLKQFEFGLLIKRAAVIFDSLPRFPVLKQRKPKTHMNPQRLALPQAGDSSYLAKYEYKLFGLKQ